MRPVFLPKPIPPVGLILIPSRAEHGFNGSRTSPTMDALRHLLAPTRHLDDLARLTSVDFSHPRISSSCSFSCDEDGSVRSLARSDGTPIRFVQNPRALATHPLLISISPDYSHLHLKGHFQRDALRDISVVLAVARDSDVSQLQARAESHLSSEKGLCGEVAIYKQSFLRASDREWTLDFDLSMPLFQGAATSFALFYHRQDSCLISPLFVFTAWIEAADTLSVDARNQAETLLSLPLDSGSINTDVASNTLKDANLPPGLKQPMPLQNLDKPLTLEGDVKKPLTPQQELTKPLTPDQNLTKPLTPELVEKPLALDHTSTKPLTPRQEPTKSLASKPELSNPLTPQQNVPTSLIPYKDLTDTLIPTQDSTKDLANDKEPVGPPVPPEYLKPPSPIKKPSPLKASSSPSKKFYPLKDSSSPGKRSSLVDHVPSKQPVPVQNFAREFRFNTADGPEFHQDLMKHELAAPRFLQYCLLLLDTMLLLKALLRRLVREKEKFASCVRELIDVRFGNVIELGDFHTQLDFQLNKLVLPFIHNMEFIMSRVCDPKMLAKITSSYELVSGEGSSNVSTASGSRNTVNGASAAGLSANSESSPPSSGAVLEIVQARKHFDAACRLYYSWVGRYLSNDKDRPPLKLLAKRKAFELAKFDYLNVLDSVTNNQYTNHFFESLFKFAQVPMNPSCPQELDVATFDDPVASQALLHRNYKAYLMILMRYNGGKYQFRQMLQAAQSEAELNETLVQGHRKLSIVHCLEHERSQVDLKNFDKFLGGDSVTPLSETDQTSGADKSGILHVYGGKGKPGWHKEWVVLRDGQLTEYADWRLGKSPVQSPIELALASIKPHVHERRLHCFEITTSQGHRHVFQALTDDDRTAWLTALYNAGQHVDHDRLQGPVSKEKRRSARRLKLVTDLPKPPSTMTACHEIMLPLSEEPLRHFAAPPQDDSLTLVRNIPDAKNSICVDCGLQESVEWISLNHLVCFCVKCASCHRSLGSHISVVRSLRLDKFEGELHILLRYVNNARANKVLEAVQSLSKPDPSASHEQRMEFIKEKYLEKLYRDPPAKRVLNSSLVGSIQQTNIGDMMESLLGGASLDLRVTILDLGSGNQVAVSLFEYSLRKYIQVDDGGERKRYFVVSELMILNGLNIAGLQVGAHLELKLSAEAKAYWERRKTKLGLDNT